MSDLALVEELFAAWLSRHEAGTAEPIEAMADAHPECAIGLLKIHAEWSRIRSLIDGKGCARESSLSDRLRERFGSGVDPGVSLDGDASDAAARSDAGVYAELQSRGPSSGRYRLDGDLAQGGMGLILRVYDKDLRRNLAMKVMLEEKEGRLSRFLEEAQVTGQLDHPGIVPVHELGIDAHGKVFFTMKLVKGRNLADVFAMTEHGEDGWNVTRALSVLLRVCEAMAFAHEKKVIHRDLKPANIMVGRHGEVYVMDWGLARVLGKKDTKDVRVAPQAHGTQSVVNTERRETAADTPDSPLLTMDGDAIGTPSYMPLEQAEGNLDAIGPASDVYAVGAMLYHLLAGHAPYVDPGETVSGRVILKRVLLAEPASIRAKAKTAPAELVAICEKAMGRKPAQRYPSMVDLGDDLRAYLERRVVKAYRTGLVAETKMWVARNRALAAAIVVGFVLLGGFAWQQRNAAASARVAAESNRLRAAERDRVLRLSDVKELRDLQARGRALLDDRAAVYRSHHGYESLVGSLRTWMTDAETLAKRLPDHEATLVEIEARGRRASDSAPFEFDTKEDAWWHSAVSELVAGFRSLTLDDPSSISTRAMRDRLAEFETIYAHSIGEHRDEWSACIASIADPAQCPQYKGLKLVPQVGLLPIGRDPESGMWEFWLVDVTGAKPERGADGKLTLSGDFGLVLVLLPGGTFDMGAQKDDPNGPNYDPQARAHEGPVHAVALAPFFLSKYEMTAHQWILGSRDEAWPYGEKARHEPADSVTWDDASAVLPTLHLDLPTEAQWEFACRAGTTTPWSTGAFPTSLMRSANVGTTEKDGRELGDVKPVGSLLANAFGLHDMHGNVLEWCRDGVEGAGDYVKTLDPVTGEHLIDRPRHRVLHRVLRGGYYLLVARDARSAYRDGNDPGNRDAGNGVRPRRVVNGD